MAVEVVLPRNGLSYFQRVASFFCLTNSSYDYSVHLLAPYIRGGRDLRTQGALEIAEREHNVLEQNIRMGIATQKYYDITGRFLGPKCLRWEHFINQHSHH